MSRSLSQLSKGESAIVVGINSPSADTTSTHLLRRLAELGFMPGETVRILRKSFGGEPIAVRVGSSTFALRKYEADQIKVELASRK